MPHFQLLLTFTTLKYFTFDSDRLMNQKLFFLLTHLFRSFVFQTSEMDIHSGTALVDWVHRKQQEGKRNHHTTSVEQIRRTVLSP